MLCLEGLLIGAEEFLSAAKSSHRSIFSRKRRTQVMQFARLDVCRGTTDPARTKH